MSKEADLSAEEQEVWFNFRLLTDDPEGAMRLASWVEQGKKIASISHLIQFDAFFSEFDLDGTPGRRLHMIVRCNGRNRLWYSQIVKNESEFIEEHEGVAHARAVGISMYVREKLEEALGRAAEMVVNEAKLKEGADNRQLKDWVYHMRQTVESDMKKRLHVKGPGQHSQWQRLELKMAVLNAQGELLKDKRSVTYDSIVEKLGQKYPEKAPPSGEALRQLLRRFDISWKQIKSVQYW